MRQEFKKIHENCPCPWCDTRRGYNTYKGMVTLDTSVMENGYRIDDLMEYWENKRGLRWRWRLWSLYKRYGKSAICRKDFTKALGVTHFVFTRFVKYLDEKEPLKTMCRLGIIDKRKRHHNNSCRWELHIKKPNLLRKVLLSNCFFDVPGLDADAILEEDGSN